MQSLSLEHRFQSPLSLVWRAISDTNRFNKALGFPPVTYKDEPQPDGTSKRFCKQVRFGIELEYEELPFAWVHERSFRVDRLYKNGPIKRLAHICHLEREDQGCVARVTWEWDPRGAIEALVSGATMRWFARKQFERVFGEIDARLLKQASAGAIEPRLLTDDRRADEEARRRIDALLPPVKAIVDSPLVDVLARAVAEGSDAELRRMQPLAFAREWSADTAKVLDVFLAATRAGLLRMRWDVICPHCRGDKKNLASLCEVAESAYCSACNIDFDVDLDRSLEAVFAPHPQVRSVEEARYCLGGPGVTPHVYYQRALLPGEEDAVAIGLEPGRYRARFTKEETYRWIDAAPAGSSEGALEISDRGIEGVDLALASDRPVKLVVRNRSTRRVVIDVESVVWAKDALSAGEMIADQQFRDLFASEVLAPGVKLGVESAAILFTDLVGSTAMYESLGDASAFSLVWTHFDALKEIVSAHRGSIVKTIGDAVMAVFMRPEDALLAAGELHARVGEFCKEKGHAHPVMLKIGIHQGPCIAVTLNDRLDYFGSTVNLAARVEAQSKGGDIIVSRALAEQTKDAEALRMLGWRSEAIAAHCKGFSEPIPMLRFSPASAERSAASSERHTTADRSSVPGRSS
jgi:class 3 adenylate cyclase